MRQLDIILSWPPSVNGYYRHIAKGPLAGRVLISAVGRAYRTTVAYECAGRRAMFDGRLRVNIQLYPPDRRVIDIDNRLKSLLDAMQNAGLYGNDSQIDELHVMRAEIIKAGKAAVSIIEFKSAEIEKPSTRVMQKTLQLLADHPPF
ncbi:MAG: RusA family crossover junction endodeoxyribonuclease [Gammaproteobacteria bacterium]|nr:RusA family crossover junction endodeoxyribonuclease [Gammaproteobacteria bacterium]